MKKQMRYALIVGCILFLTACHADPFSLKNVDHTLINNFQFDLEVDNPYLMNLNSKQYLLFYKMNLNPETVQYQLIDTKLQVSIETTNQTTGTYIYEISDPNSEVDLIQLIENGEKVPFHSVIGK